MKIKMNSLEIRVVRLLKERYPITVDELRDELSVRPDTLTRALKSLMVKQVVALEPLSDMTYIRLLTPDIDVEGGRCSQNSAENAKPRDSDDDDSFTYM
jgi:DNA-binding transcriptional ArsR family regulator